MKRPFVFLMLAISHPSFAQAPAVQDVVQKAFQERVADGLLSGVSVGYVTPSSTPAFVLGDISNTSDRFEVGSVSKSFAGIGIAKLSVDGKINLENPISNYIPELAGTFVGTVTAHLLATHSAQLIDDIPGDLTMNETQFIAFLKSYVPSADYPPGVRPYSNLGFSLLGLLIGRITGDTYENYVNKTILVPLHMSSSGFLSDQSIFLLLVGANDLFLAPTFNDLVGDLGAAAGGVYSNSLDMMKFIELNLHPETNADLKDAVLLSQKLGLGFDSLPGVTPIWKNGLMSGYASFLEFNPVTGTGVIVLNHSRNVIATESLGTIAMGTADAYEQDQKFTEASAGPMLGSFVDTNRNYQIDTSLSSAGFIEMKVTYLKNQGGTIARLRDYNGKMQVYTGLDDQDYLTFNVDPATQKMQLRYFTYLKQNSSNQATYDELDFEK